MAANGPEIAEAQPICRQFSFESVWGGLFSVADAATTLKRELRTKGASNSD